MEQRDRPRHIIYPCRTICRISIHPLFMYSLLYLLQFAVALYVDSNVRSTSLFCQMKSLFKETFLSNPFPRNNQFKNSVGKQLLVPLVPPIHKSSYFLLPFRTFVKKERTASIRSRCALLTMQNASTTLRTNWYAPINWSLTEHPVSRKFHSRCRHNRVPGRRLTAVILPFQKLLLHPKI